MFEIKSIPAFNDNYIWCIIGNNKQAYVVDPGTAAPVIEFIEANQLELAGILITHHHLDHTGGIDDLQNYTKHQLTVYGPESKLIPQVTTIVINKSTFKLDGIDSLIEVFETPGHTLDHIAYLIDDHLFCGDTLFSAGCGRLFEGTPEQMYHSLNLLASLPEATKVYPAHEYTLSNLDFAIRVEPSNSDVSQYASKCQQLRRNNIPTLPSTIETELRVNPFLRVNESKIIDALTKFPHTRQADAVTRFSALRKWKDNF